MSEKPWFGDTPEGWETIPLYAIASERKAPNAGLRESNLLSLSYGNIIRKDINTSDGLLPASFETYQVVEANDVVLRMTDLQNDQRSLRTALARERGIITSAYLALSLRNVDPRFMAYQFRAIDLMKVFYSMGGGLRQSISYGDLKRLPILLPSPAEQRAIADYLDRETVQIDAFIAKNEELIALLTERRATLIDRCVFGLSEQDSPSLMRVPEFVEEHAALRDFVRRIPATWRVGRFKALLTRRDARNWDCNATMRSLKITGEVVTRSSQQNPDESSIPRYLLVEPNDLVVNPMWLVGGAIGVSTRSGAVSPDYRVFRPRTVLHPRFLHHLLRSRPYRAQYELLTRAETTFDRRVSQRDLDRLPIPVPPPDEQSRIARVIDGEVKRIDATIEVAVKGIELARERRAALVSAAVTGKIDVGVAA